MSTCDKCIKCNIVKEINKISLKDGELLIIKLKELPRGELEELKKAIDRIPNISDRILFVPDNKLGFDRGNNLLGRDTIGCFSEKLFTY